MAFNLLDFFRKPKPAEISKEQMLAVSAQTVGTHTLVDDYLGGIPPERLASILQAATTLRPEALWEYMKIAQQVAERELHYASQLQALALELSCLPRVASPKDESAAAKSVAEALQEHVDNPAFQRALPGLIFQYLNVGFAPGELVWDTTKTPWTVSSVIDRPPRWFVFGVDGRTVLERGSGWNDPAVLPIPGKLVLLDSSMRGGMTIKNGLAWVIAWTWVIKGIVLKDWIAFCETFGQPLVIGKYPANARDADISILRRAVAAVGPTFRAVFRKDLEIDFKEIARTGNGADLYERLSRYFDELTSKLVWAQTLGSDHGTGGTSTNALGKVHQESKQAIIRARAMEVAACVQATYNTPFVIWNFGPNAPMPKFELQCEEPQDDVAESTVVKNLSDAGVELSMQEIRERFGYREPQPDEPVIGRKQPAPDPLALLAGEPQPGKPGAPALPSRGQPRSEADQAAAANASCPVHGTAHSAHAPVADKLDAVVVDMNETWRRIEKRVDAGIANLAENSTSLEDLRARLHEMVDKGTDKDLRLLFLEARTKARLAGEVGADIQPDA